MVGGFGSGAALEAGAGGGAREDAGCWGGGAGFDVGGSLVAVVGGVGCWWGGERVGVGDGESGGQGREGEVVEGGVRASAAG